MSKPLHICVNYSEGLNYVERLRSVQERYPEGRLCALVPAGYPISATEKALVDEVMEAEQAHYSPREFRACWAHVRRIRAARFDCFIVVFRSPQLRLLAALSGAPRCECWGADNEILPLSRSVPVALLARLLHAVRGRLVYARVWMSVHLWPVHATKRPEV